MGGSAIRTADAAAARACTPKVRGRADAARNRERILAAAREAFVVHGPEAPLDEIARAAGVGNATLYRHFADRDALVQGVVLFVTDGIAERAREAIDEEDSPFDALRRFVRGAAEERIGALCPMLSERFDRSDPAIVAAGSRVEDLTRELLERAQEAGEIRADIGVGDVTVALSQLTRPLPGLAAQGLAPFAERHVQLYLDGLRAPARSELPGQAATLEDLRQHNC